MTGQRQLRIRIQGRLSAETAEALGVRCERGGDGYQLVFGYVDQAQLTGLLVRLSDLHIPFDRVEVLGPPEPPAHAPLIARRRTLSDPEDA